MGFIKNLFKNRKKERDLEKEKLRIAKEEYESREIRGYCYNCGLAIELEEGYTKQQGKHYHRKCWKELIRSAW